jgi:hypothetical protein
MSVANKDLGLLSPVMRQAVQALTASLPLLVTETIRTPERQREMLATGKSKTLKSKHLDGRAVDTMPRGGYSSWTTAQWNQAHDTWERICKGLGLTAEKRIPWDLGHFGIVTIPAVAKAGLGLAGIALVGIVAYRTLGGKG